MSSRYRRKASAEKYNTRQQKLAKLEWLHNIMYQRTGRRVRFVDVSSDAALDRAITEAKAALDTPVTKSTSRTAAICGGSKIGVVLTSAIMGSGGGNKEIS